MTMRAEEAVKVLRSGGLVAMPTETVYGLFADALNEDAVRHLFDVKGRTLDHALNLNVSSYDDILRFSKNQPDNLRELVEKFLPGPLTIILEANDQVPTYINNGMTTVGFRMPAVPETLEVIREVGVLVGPSANLTGQLSSTTAAQVDNAFGTTIDGIMANDAAITGVDSTIVDLTVTPPKILRQGAITIEDLQ
jgi:L-threonylcarbamoyladenylate synthase